MGWNDRLPEDPYIPYQSQADQDASEAYAEYVAMQQTAYEKRKTDIGVCMKHRHRKKVDTAAQTAKQKTLSRKAKPKRKKTTTRLPF